LRASGFFTRREFGAALLLVLVLVFSAVKDPSFLRETNVQSILQWVPLMVVMGLGQMMVIITRGIDVSVGSLAGLTAILVGLVTRSHTDMSAPVALALGAITGLILGSFNGLLIAFAEVPPIIATLATMIGYRGLAFIASRAKQIDSNQIPQSLIDLSQRGPFRIGGLLCPWILVLAIVIVGLGAFFLKSTRPGRDVFAVGSNPPAALLRGVSVKRTQFMVFALSGLLSGIVGVFYMSRYGFVNPGSAGVGLELMVIAAAVIGGTNVAGGTGTVLGLIAGCLLLATINVSLAVLGISENYQQLVYGVTILIGVVLDGFVKQNAARLRAT